MAGAVRVKGLRETIRAFRNVDRSVIKEIRNALKEAAEPVALTARAKVSRYRQASQKINPRATGASVFVRQDAGKVSGRRGDFGALQMRTVLIPALDEHADEIVGRVNIAVERLARRNGF